MILTAAAIGLSVASGLALAGPPEGLLLELVFVDHQGTAAEQQSTRVRVLASGDVQTADASGNLSTRFRMTPGQVASLQRDIFGSQQLATIDSSRLARSLDSACRTTGLSPRIEGSGSTVIRWQAGEQSGEVGCHALSVMAARFPDFPEVQRLIDCQLRLQNVAAVADAGGYEAAEQFAKIANNHLQQQHPDTQPLQSEELSMYRSLSTGNRYIQFYRRPLGDRAELIVSLFDSPGQPPRVEVLATPATER
ncbi:MAG: hypothetical protein R3B90_00880 [Planctomycetaceae bacterium]